MTKEPHEDLKKSLAQIGVTDEEHVQQAIEAEEAGLAITDVIGYMKAGVPAWLALLYALHEHLQRKEPTGATRTKAKKEDAK